MDLIILITELIMKNVAQFGTITGVMMVGAIVLYSLKKQNEDRAHSDEQFAEILASQEEMKKEYREGFIKTNRDIAEINRLTKIAFKEIKEQQKENNMLTLRGLVTNTALPVEYRLRNYDIYLSQGGNSWLSDYVKSELLQEKGEE